MNRITCFIIVVLLTFINVSWAEAKKPIYHGFIIGLTGKNETFDHQAFFKFAKSRKLLPIVLSWQNETIAYNVINNSQGYYELYGFSKGAETSYNLVNRLAKNKVRLPGFVITIGAYKDANVDFSKFNIEFKNYFDTSGIGQKSPGIHIKDKEHLEMQDFVNRIYLEDEQ